jgi:hypothetical protein
VADSVTQDYNGGSQAITSNSYDMFGDLLSTQLSSGSSLLYKTTNTYNSLNKLTASTTTDASNNVISAATYGYDQTTPTATSGLPQHVAVSGTRGNQTSSTMTISGSNTLSTTTAYYDTGTRHTARRSSQSDLDEPVHALRVRCLDATH